MSNKFDIIIVGGGMGGLMAGAILAKLDRRRVLVLERAPRIGGRVISYGGPHGKYSAKEYADLQEKCAGIRFLRTEPSLEAIVEDHKLFDNFILDAGWHLVTGSGRNRYSIIAKALDKTIPVAGQKGLFLLDGTTGQSNAGFEEWTDYTRGWPQETRDEHLKVATDRLAMSVAESAQWDNITMRDYINSKTTDPKVRQNYEMLARFLLIINEPTRLSAGEFIRTNNYVSNAGGHLSKGGGIGEVVGGFYNIARVFAEVIEECGGEIRTSTEVEEVLFDDFKVSGVRVRADGATSVLTADNYIINVPTDAMRKIIPAEHLPEELNKRLDDLYPGTGIVGQIGIKELVESDRPKGVFVVDPLPGAPRVLGGGTCMGWEQTTGIDPSRKLGASHLIQTWIPVNCKNPDERKDEALLQSLCDATLAWFRNQYSSWDSVYEWSTFGLPERVYGIAPVTGLMGERRPPVSLPTVSNLFFAGDTTSQNDFGTNGAAHSAMLAANAISGRDFLPMVPDFMR